MGEAVVYRDGIGGYFIAELEQNIPVMGVFFNRLSGDSLLTDDIQSATSTGDSIKDGATIVIIMCNLQHKEIVTIGDSGVKAIGTLDDKEKAYFGIR